MRTASDPEEHQRAELALAAARQAAVQARAQAVQAGSGARGDHPKIPGVTGTLVDVYA